MQPKLSSSEGWRGKNRLEVVARVIGAVCMGHAKSAPPEKIGGAEFRVIDKDKNGEE